MNRFVGALVLVVSSFAFCACGVSGDKEKKEEKKKEEPKTKLVGRVASLAPDKKFVLVQSYGSWEVPVGSVLTTRGAQDRMANLRSTGEHLGQFAAADIQAGDPQVGDAVYLHVSPPAKSDPAPDAEGGKPPAPPSEKGKKSE